jgi:general control protein GCN4
MSRSTSAPLNQGASDMNMFSFTDMGAGPAGNPGNPGLFDETFDLNVSTNTQSSFHSSDEATVSPQDLFKDPSPSAPPSSAFTNLTSPSWDSPDVTESFDTSPLFYANDNDLGVGDKWFPLFPGDHTGSDESPPTQTKEVHDRNSLTSEARRRSSPSQSPYGRGAHAKHSSISGVGSRRRDRPLPEIRPEDASDPVSAKRVRNTLAARKSRQKKVEKFDLLEQKIADLTDEVEYWKNMAQGSPSG